MQTTRTVAFPPDDVTLASQLKALAHPARLAILRTLAQRQTCICGDLVEVLPLAQATVSQHLKVLREVGLVRGETDGPRSCYCLDTEALQRVHDTLGTLFSEINYCCGC